MDILKELSVNLSTFVLKTVIFKDFSRSNLVSEFFKYFANF